jgi:hypothetical protein
MKLPAPLKAFAGLAAAALLAATARAQGDATPSAGALAKEDARAIAKDAFIYGYPMVDGYRINFAFYLFPGNPEYKGPQNQLLSMPRLFTPKDTAVQTPNSDTPYSFFGADLRVEPFVITVPEIEKERYFSIQLVDAYTHNFAYIGSRTTGNGAASYLLAGPGWKGEKPAGIKEVIPCETNLALGIYRTQLFNPEDMAMVKKIQDGYRFEPLSKFLGREAPPAAPKIDYVRPVALAADKTPLEFFKVLNFVLTLCPTVPSEQDLMARFAKIGVGAGKPFDPETLEPELKEALAQGIADGWNEYLAFKSGEVDTGKVTSGDLFGTRAELKSNYLYRMAAAIIGIYGNSKAEAMYPLYSVDAKGGKLDATTRRYTLRFAPGQLPPVHAFWSVTMYDLPKQLLVENPLDRYLINSPMLPGLKKDADGGLTLHIQHESPGKELEANWLPAPKGPFFMAMRLYWPRDEALDGSWTAPKLTPLD